jgi:hypothetical protein
MLPDSAPPQTNTAAPPTPASTRTTISASNSRTQPVAAIAREVTTIPRP